MRASLIDRMPCRSVDDVIGWIDAHAARLASEDQVATGALGRILAEDVAAAGGFPAFDRATIDGAALRAADTVGASAYNPLAFALPDRPEALPAGAAARLRAGDRLPAGADAIVPLEFTQPGADGTIEIMETVPPEHGVERQASHFTRGTALFQAGRCLRPADLGLLAIGGIGRLTVVRQPRVAIVLTGGAADPAAAASAPSIAMLQPMLERDGGLVAGASRIERTVAAIRGAVSAAGADAVLVVGGPDRGRDHEAAAALAEIGEVAIAEVALSPGGNIVMGRTAAGTSVFSLPDTPSSCFWAYEALIGRAIRRLAGRDPALPFPRREMKLARKIVSTIGVTEMCPVQRRTDGSVEPLVEHARSNLRMVTQADGFVIVGEGSEGMPVDAVAPVHLFEGCATPHPQYRPGTGMP